MTRDRHLAWKGCYNARDLGGLKLRNGGETRWGTLVRSDNPERMTEATWSAVRDYGIRTRIDLRNPDEMLSSATPAGITKISLPLEDPAGQEWWAQYGPRGSHIYGTPLYYASFLDRFPHQIAKVCTAIARAEPGGVLFHCAAGRDRTGLISLVLLSLADVEAEEIAADHALSNGRLIPAWDELNLEDQTPAIENVLARNNTTARESLLATIAAFDTAKYLAKAGMTSGDIAALRDRLV
jgi:protein tyrosine/serine phosphatase